MSAFILWAWVLSRVLPFHRLRNTAELDSQRVVPVDGLRGILAVSVFFQHALNKFVLERTGLWSTPPSNFYAQVGVLPVCMFFFITGYVFWLKLLKQPSIPLLPFLYARLGRLAGAYWLACVLCFALAAVVSGYHCNLSVAKLAVQAIGWLTFFGTGHNINGIPNSMFWLGMAWTLRYEWMFYVSLPLLGWFARRRARLPVLFAAATAASLLLHRLHPAGTAMAAAADLVAGYARFLAYIFMVGIVMAAAKFPDRVKAWARTGTASLIGLLLMAVTLLFVPPDYNWLEGLTLAIPFAVICLGNTWFGLLSSEPVRFLGRISYSFYLLHVFVLTTGLAILGRYVRVASLGSLAYWSFCGVCGGLTILLSAFSYQYLEYPFLHVGKRRGNTPASRPRSQSQSTAARESHEAIAETVV